MITSVIDVLPQKVANCEVQCKNSEDISVQMKKDMMEIQQRNIILEKTKTDKKLFQNFQTDIERRMVNIENGVDGTIDKTRSLENWIDIYLPLRI